MLSNGILVELPWVVISHVVFFVSLKKQTNKHPQQNKSKSGGFLLIKLLGSLCFWGTAHLPLP